MRDDTVCNKCGEVFKLIPANYYIDKLEDNWEAIGLQCPKCKEKYHAYYLTPRLKKQQHELKIAKTKKHLRRIQRNYEKEYLRVQAEGIKKYGALEDNSD